MSEGSALPTGWARDCGGSRTLHSALSRKDTLQNTLNFRGNIRNSLEIKPRKLVPFTGDSRYNQVSTDLQPY